MHKIKRALALLLKAIEKATDPVLWGAALFILPCLLYIAITGDDPYAAPTFKEPDEQCSTTEQHLTTIHDTWLSGFVKNSCFFQFDPYFDIHSKEFNRCMPSLSLNPEITVTGNNPIAQHLYYEAIDRLLSRGGNLTVLYIAWADFDTFAKFYPRTDAQTEMKRILQLMNTAKDLGHPLALYHFAISRARINDQGTYEKSILEAYRNGASFLDKEAFLISQLDYFENRAFPKGSEYPEYVRRFGNVKTRHDQFRSLVHYQ